MIKNITISVLSLLILATGAGALHAKTVDKVVAIVNEEPITLYELDLLMAQGLEHMQGAMTGTEKEKRFKNTRSAALKMLIEEKLLDQELARRNVEITKADEDKAVKNVLERNNMTIDQLKAELKGKGQTWDDYMLQVKTQLKRIKFMGQVLAPKVRVTDQDLDEFFAKNSDKFAQFQSVELAQVIVPFPAGGSEADFTKAQATAQEVAKKARGGADFADLGEKYSNTPQTAQKQTYPTAALAPAIAATLSEMSPGQVSDPVRSSMGFHVIKLFERSTMQGEEFKGIREQVRERVFELKLQEELEEYLDEVKKKSYIEVKL